MNPAVFPQAWERQAINEAVRAEINLCFTCGSCATECPINRATNELHPRKLVWMANLGLMDELLRSPEIWMCLACGKCSHVCPMTVKPARLFAFLRWESVRRQVVAADFFSRWRVLRSQFQHERLRAADGLMDEHSQVQTKLQETGGHPFYRDVMFFDGYATGVTSCFACGECSNACPVCFDRSVFDPLRFFRAVMLGDSESVLRSSSLWLCIQCQSCTEACSQGVRGHLVIRRLRELADERGWISPDFRREWSRKDRNLYGEYVNRVTELLKKEGIESCSGSEETMIS